MKISMHITKEDYWKFNKFVMYSMPKYRKVMLANIIGLPLFLSIILKVIGKPWVYSIVVGVALGVLLNVFMYFSIKRKVIRWSASTENAAWLGDHTMEIAEQGIDETTPVGSAHYNWDAIPEIRMTKDYIYIFISSMQAHIIPLACLSNPSEQTQLIQLLEEHHKKKIIVHS